MTESWTPQTVAQEFLKLMPMFGRLMSKYIHESEEGEATLMQVMVLSSIRDKAITASELAKKRRVSPQAASTLVQNLVERGWIMRVPDPNDRRQSILQITPEGEAYSEIINAEIVNYLAGYLNELTPEQIAAAQAFLPAIYHILTEQASEPVFDK